MELNDPASPSPEDELFGDLIGDDHAAEHDRDYCDDMFPPGNLQHPPARPTVDGLALHEARAAEEAAYKRGFLEGCDVTKDERLQDGFEVGYRETLDAAMRIGKMLGEAVAAASAEGLLDIHTADAAAEAGACCPLAPSLIDLKDRAQRAAVAVRGFLDEAQRGGGSTGTETEAQALPPSKQTSELERTLQLIMMDTTQETHEK